MSGIRIIQRGKIDVYQGRCAHCDCRVEVDKDSDEVVIPSEPGETVSDSSPWVACPTKGCDSKISLEQIRVEG